MAETTSAMTGFRPKKGLKVRPEINVTPLVDVVLVLLIIFMVVTPELEKGGRVTLPNVRHPDPTGQKQEEGIAITVSVDGRFYLDGEELARADLLGKVKEKKTAFPDKRLFLKGDDGRPYGEMRDLFRDLQKAGFTGVRLMVSAPATTGTEE